MTENREPCTGYLCRQKDEAERQPAAPFHPCPYQSDVNDDNERFPYTVTCNHLRSHIFHVRDSVDELALALLPNGHLAGELEGWTV